MAVETLFAQITHEAPSASMTETPLVPICCLCQLVRDETGASLDSARWVTQRTYRKKHGVNPTKLVLTYTYCPKCYHQVMDIMRAAPVMETLVVA
jgi:hypothetical protein